MVATPKSAILKEFLTKMKFAGFTSLYAIYNYSSKYLNEVHI